MAPCFLLDLPDCAIETILQHLDSRDHASLRQVSRLISKRTTEHVPYIVLLLSDASSAHQLQQWGYVMQQMQHVTSIHIRIAGAVSAAVFDMAMQLLSKRSSKVTELHLLAATAYWSGEWWPSMPRSTAHIVSLQSLKHLLTDLQGLVIKGIAFRNLADDLQQLAAEAVTTGGWLLQLFYLDAYWGLPYSSLDPCADFCSALVHLSEAFPALERLSLWVPWQEFGWVSQIGIASDCDYDNYYEHYHDSGYDDDDDHEHDDDAVSDPEAEQETASSQDSYAEHLEKRQVSAVTFVAAIVNAVAKLTNLESLGLYHIPDIWKPRIEASQAHGSTLRQQQQAVAVAARAATSATTPALSSGLLPSLSAATAAFATLDDCGCFLLQHLPRMQVMYMYVAAAKFGMCWRRQQQQVGQQPSASRTCYSRAASSLHGVHAVWSPRLCKPSSASEGSSSRSSDGLVQGFNLHLSHYTSLPYVDLLHLVTIHCKLDLNSYDVNRLQLASLLGELKSLVKLEVSVTCAEFLEGRSDTAHLPTATIAPLHKLKSLILKSSEADWQFPSDLLLSLTAAAAGPGSSLKRLVLSADLSPRAAAATTVTDRASAEVPQHNSNSGQQLVPNALTAGWLNALLQLDALRELVIHQLVDPLVDLPVECLPVSLEILECRGLNLTTSSSAFTAAAAAASASPVGSGVGGVACITAPGAIHSSPDVLKDPAAGCLQLRVLYLADCRLISPSILASNRLQQLTVVNSSWSGGWAAAAAAWPHVGRLAWSEACAMGDSDSLIWPVYGPKYRLHTSGLSYENIKDAVHDILLCLRHLSRLTLHVDDLYPLLSIEFLQPLMHHLQRIKQLGLGCKSSGISNADCMAMKLWLRQQLPWASVDIFR